MGHLKEEKKTDKILDNLMKNVLRVTVIIYYRLIYCNIPMDHEYI